MKESITVTNVSDNEEVKYIQVIPNETEFLEWQRKRICKNCKWFSGETISGYNIYCLNEPNKSKLTGCYLDIPNLQFGCNQWEKIG